MNKKTKHIVYLATSPSGNKYVGVTSRPLKERIRAHINDCNKPINATRKFYRAIIKYGIENIKFEVIDYAGSLNELPELEKHYIKTLDTYNNGYNSTVGGEGCQGLIMTDETRERMRQSKARLLSNPDNLKRWQDRCKALSANVDVAKKISESNRKRYQRNPHLAIANGERKRKAMSDINQYNRHALLSGAKPFYAFDKQGNYKGTFLTKQQAADAFAIKSRFNISSCLSGHLKTCGGIVFAYKDSAHPFIERNKNVIRIEGI